eukprot:scaffold14.g1218.t1
MQNAERRQGAAFVPSSRARPARGGGGGAGPGAPGAPTLKAEAAASNEEVYDRLIEVFRGKTPAEWRRLIAYSKQWPSLAAGVLARTEARAAAASGGDASDGEGRSSSEGGEDEGAALRRLARQLSSVHEEVSSYEGAIAAFRDAPSREWESMVVTRRTSLGTEFFNYLELKIRAAHESRREQEALSALAAQLLALVEAHDRVMHDEEAMDAAADKFSNLLDVQSLEEAERRIDDLAASGRLDPALLLTMAKAYAGAKETDITREEARGDGASSSTSIMQVKDIMAHLYFKAKESFAQQAPPEVRILKFLLSVDSPADRAKLLGQAFEAGPALATADADYLHTTPQVLLNTVDNVLALYDGAAGGGGGRAGGMAREAAGLMNPTVIDRLRELQQLIRRQYT